MNTLRRYSFLLILSFMFVACQPESKEQVVAGGGEESKMAFDEAKWRLKKDGIYPYREQMLHAVVYNDTIRSLNETEILAHLGEPDRTSDGYFYYRISDTKVFGWTLHATTMVIKFTEDDRVEWIRIHE